MMDDNNIGRIGGTDAAARAGKVTPSSSHKGKSSSSASGFGSDKIEISKEGEYAAKLMSEVSSMPETRPQIVDELKAKVRGGNWPPPALVDGLVRLIGNNLLLEGEA